MQGVGLVLQPRSCPLPMRSHSCAYSGTADLSKVFWFFHFFQCPWIVAYLCILEHVWQRTRHVQPQALCIHWSYMQDDMKGYGCCAIVTNNHLHVLPARAVTSKCWSLFWWPQHHCFWCMRWHGEHTCLVGIIFKIVVAHYSKECN